MHIAQIVPGADGPWSGITTVVVHLAAALKRRHVDIEVWHMADWPAARFSHHIDLLEQAGVNRVRVPAGRSARQTAAAAGALATDRGIDLVHLHGAFNISNTTIARALRVPYAFSPHSGYDPVSLGRSPVRKRAYRALLELPMLRRASLLTALTEQERDHLRAFGARGRCVVVPNGVAPPPPGIDSSIFRRELGLSNGDLLAVFVGRLDLSRKGLDELVPAMTEAPTWHLALIGPDERRGMDALTADIRSLNLEGRVQVLDGRYGRALHEALAAANLFVLLSRWEGMPMALLEALSHGVPALVSPEVERIVNVSGAEAGWVAQRGRAGAVLREIAALDRRGWTARQRTAVMLSKRYDWDDVAASYQDAYTSALQRAAI